MWVNVIHCRYQAQQKDVIAMADRLAYSTRSSQVRPHPRRALDAIIAASKKPNIQVDREDLAPAKNIRRPQVAKHEPALTCDPEVLARAAAQDEPFRF